jgi:protein-S-isoprenylcysteine O-methyltransferase Ste14
MKRYFLRQVISIMPLSEEPGLFKRFSQAYAIYKRHVPRWIPRLKPWDREGESQDQMG